MHLEDSSRPNQGEQHDDKLYLVIAVLVALNIVLNSITGIRYNTHWSCDVKLQ